MRLSVITPTLNQAAYIKETLGSVAEQDYPDIEHIVVDGGSTDGTQEILSAWDGRWISEPDAGQADAINKGTAIASGEVITWLNSDDFYLSPTVISSVIAEFERGAQVVTGLGMFTNEAGESWYEWPPEYLGFLDDTLRCRDTVLQPATFYRADLARRMPLDTTLHYAFDWDFFIRLREVTPFTPLPVRIAGYRWHKAGKTVVGGGSRKRELLEISRRYRGLLHPASLAMTVMVPIYTLADRLPTRAGRRIYRELDRLCLASQRRTGMRGIQD